MNTDNVAEQIVILVIHFCVSRTGILNQYCSLSDIKYYRYRADEARKWAKDIFRTECASEIWTTELAKLC